MMWNQYNPYGYGAVGQQMAQSNPYLQSGYSSMGQQNTAQTGGELVTVQTIAQVEQVGLQPGQRRLVMVQNEPVIAARCADNMGLVSTQYYRLEEFTPGAPAAASAEYVTRAEFDAFVASLKGAGGE
jgi:hypothetical protein